MDLLELNDVHCKDKARMTHDEFFKGMMRIECPFIPLEDPVFSINKDNTIEAIVNNPFDGSRSISLRHSLKDFVSMIHKDTPVTDYFPTDSFASPTRFDTGDIRMQNYQDKIDLDNGCHYDITFSDIIPGLTLIMDRIKNNNIAFSKDTMGCDRDAAIRTPLKHDGRSLSLIYVGSDGTKRCGYGSIIYTSRGVSSLSAEMKMYLLSNTYIVGRSYLDTMPDSMQLKTSCMILYEDSILKILDVEKDV